MTAGWDQRCFSKNITGCQLTSPTLLLDQLQDMLGEIDHVRVDVVLNQQHRVLLFFAEESIVDGALDDCKVRVGIPVTSVNFLVDNMVAKVTHIFHATRDSTTLDVGRPHV